MTENNNVIIVKGVLHNDIKKTLRKADKQKKKKAEERLKKRFQIISSILLGLFVVIQVIFLSNIQLFCDVIIYFELAIGMWFMMDYIMLRDNKYYVKCLIIAIVYFVYGILLKNVLSINLLPTFASPICLLIIQKSLRMVYLRILKKEPEINGYSGSFAELIYTLLLFASMAVLPFVMMSFI